MRKEQIWDEAFVGRVRALQSAYPAAHAAARNWGAWSRDRYKIGPKEYQEPSLWDNYKYEEGDYAREGEAEVIPIRRAQNDRKAELPDKEPYDEKSAVVLDERLHAWSGLSLEVQRILRTAYVSREVPEVQFARLSGCSEDAFCERLSEALGFISRFV